jgi:hypothetical protein
MPIISVMLMRVVILPLPKYLVLMIVVVGMMVIVMGMMVIVAMMVMVLRAYCHHDLGL